MPTGTPSLGAVEVVTLVTGVDVGLVVVGVDVGLVVEPGMSIVGPAGPVADGIEVATAPSGPDPPPHATRARAAIISTAPFRPTLVRTSDSPPAPVLHPNAQRPGSAA